jgi:adenine-specific DNA-methyltransferase
VEVAQLSLYLKLLQDETPASARGYQMEFHETLLPSLSKNIVCGNSLVGTDILSGELFEPVEERKLNPMDFEDRFPQIFRRKTSGGELRETPASPMDWTMPGAPLHGGFSYKKSKKDKVTPSPALPVSEFEGGFDAIVGNPPYGAELKPLERTYLQKTYNVSITDTAALFILRQIQLLKPNAPGSFIVPKPLIYASNWKEVRSTLLPDLLELCDCSKVWPEVKLEQIIYRLQKGSKVKTYKSFNRNKEAFEYLGDLEKQLCERFEFILSNVSPEHVKLALKLKKSGRYLADIIENRRGAMLQSKTHPTNGEFRVIGGKQIGRYELAKDWKGYISKKSATDENAFVGTNSVLVQNIVAHIANPKDHIQIIATLLPPTLQKDSVILDTVNQLSVTEPWPAAFVAGLLNSQLVNWFVYRFIFARAIRTMHFDSPITSRIPFPNIDLNRRADESRCEQIVALVEQMLAAKPQLARAQCDKDKNFYENKCAALDRQIDALVYELYGLTEEEIKIVESAA